MISIVEHVVVIYLGWKQPKKYCVRYFWPMIFKDCVEVVKSVILVKYFLERCAHPAPLFPVITIGPFTKWGIDFMTCHPPLARGNHYIIMVIDYFTKWVEAMPTFTNDGETATLFIFNQIISRFGVPRDIVTDHGSHFQN
jgi:hypothetical protein